MMRKDALDITSAFRGITTPVNELYDEIHKRGWTVENVDFNQDAYVASAKNPHGEKVEKTGPDSTTAVANLLMAIIRKEFIRASALKQKLGMWATNFTDQLEQVARAYADAPVYDPKAAPAWKELADDSMRRWQTLQQQIQIEVVDKPDPYKDAQEMCQDVHQNKHIFVSRANSQHPVWTVEQNVAFRVVHDILGHCASGGDFGWVGENAACAAHFPLLSPTAQEALFGECIGQTAYAAFYRSFGPQKVCLLSDFIHPAQEAENGSGHWGIHPSQSLAPTQMPGLPPSPSVGLDRGYVAPHQEALGLTPVMTKVAGTIKDPNQGWESGQDPLPDNAYMMYGDPLEFHKSWDIGRKIDTGWSKLIRPDGTPDMSRMRQAIVNAFRAVLLSPQKDLRWNAVHYQDISDIPHDVEDPKVYWDRLEQRREHWNQSRGRAPGAHQVFWKPLQEFYAYMKATNPWMDDAAARQEADREVMNMRMEEEQRILEDTPDKPADELERRVNESLARRLKLIVNPKYNAEMDFPENAQGTFYQPLSSYPEATLPPNVCPNCHARGNSINMYGPEGVFQCSSCGHEWNLNDPLFMSDGFTWKDEDQNQNDPFNPYRQSAQFNLLTGDEGDLYGAFMGSHLKSISKISEYADMILQAALKDVRDHDGAGHHFRATTLNLGVPGVGPKVCSLAWLFLQPLTSQLATIDSHMMDVLNRKPEKEMNNRDYFKFERELKAARDASGYGHMPLGLYQWAMWDHKRTGPGSHQDHSALKVLDPTPHQHIDWSQKASLPRGQKWEPPEWWKATKPARDQVAAQYDAIIGSRFPRHEYPFQQEPVTVTASLPDDAFHFTFQVPPHAKHKIAEYARALEWPEEHELQDPDEYHITVFTADHGWDEKENHEWAKRNERNALPFRATKLELFDGYKGDLGAVVMRLDSDGLSEWANKMIDEADERGMEPRKFDRFKAHVTIGHANHLPEGSPPMIKFRSGPTYVSRPQALPDNTPILDAYVGPKKSKMEQVRGDYGLRAQEVWAL